MSYLRYLCLLAHTCSVFNTYCDVFLFCFSSSCVPYMLPVSLDYPFWISPSVLSIVYLYGYYGNTRDTDLFRNISSMVDCFIVSPLFAQFASEEII
jgi:hypothetical protein